MPRIVIAECRQEVSTFNPAASHYEDYVVSFGEEVARVLTGQRPLHVVNSEIYAPAAVRR